MEGAIAVDFRAWRAESRLPRSIDTRIRYGLIPMPRRDLPQEFERTVRAAFPEGAAWLRSLPSLIAECERRWQVSVDAEPFDLSYNFVAPAVTHQGRDVVVKIGVPCPELRNEITALSLYRGGAAVELLDADPEHGMLLLERVQPAATLTTVDDECATRIAAGVMRDLWRPLPPAHEFPTAADWASGLRRLRLRFDGDVGPFDRSLVARAESLFRELLGSSAAPVLVHGDLQHFNILSATRRPWTAIDPKGLAAEPAYDVGALLRNPAPDRFLDSTVQRRRVDILEGELGFDRSRIIAWGIAQAVLSAWWAYEDRGAGWESGMACADTLARL